jgi:hypothetical protein
MGKLNSVRSGAGPQPDYLELRKLVVNLINEYLRLTEPDRRKVTGLLDKFFLGQADTLPTWDHWSEDDMQACCLQLQPISRRMANDFRRWASELLKTGRNNRFEVGLLKDELQERGWTGITSVGL